MIDDFRDDKYFKIELLDSIKYSGGSFVVQSGLDCREALQAYIANCDFLHLPEESRIYTHNKRYRVYAFYLSAAERDVILKVSWANPEYGCLRRLNILWHQWFKNYAKSAFFGALALNRIGIRTIRPLAYWSYRTSALGIEQWFLYEKRPAVSSVLDLVRECEGCDDCVKSEMLDAVIDRMADIVRSMHAHKFRHDDIAAGNFLIEIGDLTAPESDPVRRYNVSVIDTDHITYSRFRFGLLKRILDLRDLRRLNLSREGQRRFMKRYLGEDYSEKWWNVFVFWKKYGKNPLQLWLKTGIKKVLCISDR